MRQESFRAPRAVGSVRTVSTLLITIVSGVLVGATLGVSSAQDRPPGQLDQACAADCAVRGYEPDFCGKVCWVPASGRPGEATDWICLRDCRDRGGRFTDCRSSCRLN